MSLPIRKSVILKQLFLYSVSFNLVLISWNSFFPKEDDMELVCPHKDRRFLLGKHGGAE